MTWSESGGDGGGIAAAAAAFAVVLCKHLDHVIAQCFPTDIGNINHHIKLSHGAEFGVKITTSLVNFAGIERFGGVVVAPMSNSSSH